MNIAMKISHLALSFKLSLENMQSICKSLLSQKDAFLSLSILDKGHAKSLEELNQNIESSIDVFDAKMKSAKATATVSESLATEFLESYAGHIDSLADQLHVIVSRIEHGVMYLVSSKKQALGQL